MSRAGVLVRISDDRDDERDGVRRQEADSRALAAARGLDVVDVFYENDTSAYRRRRITLPDGTRALRVLRPEYRRALAALNDGSIDVLIGYDLDRIARDPRDLEDLIDVVEATGRSAISVTGSLQLENSAGITMARVGVAMANQSSRDTARRVARARADAAEQGRWGGGGRRPYGLTSDRKAVVTHEAEVIAGIAADLLAGRSLYWVQQRLNRDGVLSASGGQWTANAVRNVVTKPAVAGLLVYRGEIVATPAPWPPILDRATWDQVREVLSSRTPRNSPQLTHWLSGLLVCGLCGQALRANGNRYWCGSTLSRGMTGCGGISIVREPTEQLLAELLFDRVSTTRIRPTRAASVAPDDSQLTELAAMWADQEISLAEYRVARAKILERLATPAVKRRPAVPTWLGRDLPARWPDLTPAARRHVASAFLEGVIVHRSSGGRWSPERLTVQWWPADS